MERTIRIVLICAVLGGCASSGGLSYLSTGPAASDKPAQPAPAAAPAPAQAENRQGGFWSRVFGTGAQPVAQNPAGTPAPGTLDSGEALRLINVFRATKGLAPLTLDPQVTAAAEALVRDMALHDRMSHVGPGGQDVGKRLLAAGYSYRLAAENVGVGQASIAETIEGWEKSGPNSRILLLPNAKHIGIAYQYKPDSKHKTFWALVVAAP